MFLLVVAGLVIAGWSVWIRQDRWWTSPKWRAVAAAASLVAVTASFAISAWMLGSHRGEELFYGTLMRMQPWPRIASYSSVLAILAALVGKKGIRVLVVSAALLIEFTMFAAVMAD